MIDVGPVNIYTLMTLLKVSSAPCPVYMLFHILHRPSSLLNMSLPIFWHLPWAYLPSFPVSYHTVVTPNFFLLLYYVPYSPIPTHCHPPLPAANDLYNLCSFYIWIIPTYSSILSSAVPSLSLKILNCTTQC